LWSVPCGGIRGGAASSRPRSGGQHHPRRASARAMMIYKTMSHVAVRVVVVFCVLNLMWWFNIVPCTCGVPFGGLWNLGDKHHLTSLATWSLSFIRALMVLFLLHYWFVDIAPRKFVVGVILVFASWM
jgi:hypothetical protein